MKSLSKGKRDQLILTSLLTLAILVGLWYGLLALQKKSLRNIAHKISEQQIKVSSAERLVQSEHDMQTRLDLTKDKLHAIEQGMAAGDMYSWIFLTMNKFRTNYNVEIPQFSREVSADVGVLPHFPYKAVLFNVRGTAFYHDFGRFLADFENTFPYMRVQNLELEPGANTSAGNPVAASAAHPGDNEKLAFRMEIVALVNPNTH